jgi:charged multivesicular body protein 5
VLPELYSLEKKVEDIDAKLVKLKQQISAARTPAAKNAAKTQALRLLKQKKVYMSHLEQVSMQQMNLESANFMAQQMKDTADQVAVMKQVKNTISTQMAAVGIDDVEQLQDDMADLYVRLCGSSALCQWHCHECIPSM